MDPKLAEIYGTNQEADLEKLAAAELAEGLANDEQLNLDGLSEDELEALAQDVLNGEEAATEEQPAGDEAQEKLAEADYLGRVMAHSYVNELRSIEKTAKAEGPMTAVQSAKRDERRASTPNEPTFGAKAENKIRGAAKSVAGVGKRYGQLMAGGAKGEMGAMAGKRAGNALLTSLRSGSGMRGEALKSLGARGGTAAGVLGLGALAAHKMKSKESSALGTLVEARAQEILAESGIDANELELVDGQEKTSDPREALVSAVEQRAWDLLGQYGVVPNQQ